MSIKLCYVIPYCYNLVFIVFLSFLFLQSCFYHMSVGFFLFFVFVSFLDQLLIVSISSEKIVLKLIRIISFTLNSDLTNSYPSHKL